MERSKKLEHTRHLSLWHDHSVVLSRGYILVTLSVIFDEAVFDVSLYDGRNICRATQNIYDIYRPMTSYIKETGVLVYRLPALQ